MKQAERIKTVDKRFYEVTTKSWTWNRLTEKERKAFTEIPFYRIKSTRNEEETIDMYELLYHAFLLGAGYNPMGWREEDSEVLTF